MAAINIKLRYDPGIDLTGCIYGGENNFPANMLNDVHLGGQDWAILLLACTITMLAHFEHQI